MEYSHPRQMFGTHSRLLSYFHSLPLLSQSGSQAVIQLVKRSFSQLFIDSLTHWLSQSLSHSLTHSSSTNSQGPLHSMKHRLQDILRRNIIYDVLQIPCSCVACIPTQNLYGACLIFGQVVWRTALGGLLPRLHAVPGPR